MNIGLDLTALSDRLRFVGDAYVRNTTDMYIPGMTLPAVFGASAPRGNYGDLKTTGWEASLSWRDRFSLSAKPFNYDIRFTMADSKSEITKYNNPEMVLTDHYVGEVLGEIWVSRLKDFFVDTEDIASHANQSLFKSNSQAQIAPGDIKLKDLDPDGDGPLLPDGVIDYGTNRIGNTGDKRIIGNSAAHYTLLQLT